MVQPAGWSTSGLPSPAAVESPSTTACTLLRAGPVSLATVGSGACPTSPVSEPTCSSRDGAVYAVTMMPPRSAASARTSPSPSSARVLRHGNRAHPHSAPASSSAQAAVMAASHTKYRVQAVASASPMATRTGTAPRAGLNIEASWRSRVMWDRVSRGRTGPAKFSVVGSFWPNRSTSPGPDRLRVGAAAPTPISSPATAVSCSGVTARASAMEAAATSTPTPR